MKIIKKTIISLAAIILLFFAYLFIGSVKPAQNINWGVVFSQKHAEQLGLDWQETYLALLEDLKVKNLKVASYWDIIEQNKGEYYFNDLDWQIEKAKQNKAKIMLVIGMKSPRWPECHIPEWAKKQDKQEQQENILALIEKIVLRYKDEDSIIMWQVENEPFFPFGECFWADKDFLEKGVDLVKLLDPQHRKSVISESGEGPFWIRAASVGDIVGVSMYEKIWVRQFGFYFTYPFPPVFYHRKAVIINRIFNKEVIGVELQAEPWGPKLLYYSPLEEQEKTMNLEQFKYNVDFAKKTGLKTHYLWGGEWWYWMKIKQQKPEIWNEAKKLFQ